MTQQTDAAAEQAVTTTLDEHDMGYHRHISEQAEQEAPQMQQEAQRLTKALQDMQGAQVSWAGYLQKKYGLGEGDFVSGDGTIIRRQQPPGTPRQEISAAAMIDNPPATADGVAQAETDGATP